MMNGKNVEEEKEKKNECIEKYTKAAIAFCEKKKKMRTMNAPVWRAPYVRQAQQSIFRLSRAHSLQASAQSISPSLWYAGCPVECGRADHSMSCPKSKAYGTTSLNQFIVE